jgi:hypothetical protein
VTTRKLRGGAVKTGKLDDGAVTRPQTGRQVRHRRQERRNAPRPGRMGRARPGVPGPDGVARARRSPSTTRSSTSATCGPPPSPTGSRSSARVST